MRGNRRGVGWGGVHLFFSGALIGLLAMSAEAQMPGLPVLQNAWANPGFTAGLNVGGGDDAVAAAVAAACAPGAGRFQLSAGIGTRRPEGGDAAPTFGARVSVPVFSFANGRLGVAAFAGAGGARDRLVDDPDRRTVNTFHVPVGLGVGYRRPFGAIRGMSAYLVPFYSHWRTEFDGATSSGGGVRVAAGADIGITRRIGVTAGVEGGQRRGTDEVGPGAVLFAGGVSYAFGRR
jgi:hypothetical protein